MCKNVTIEPKKDLTVGFSYIDNRDYGFLYLEVKYPPPKQYDKEAGQFIEQDKYTEVRKIAKEKHLKFFSYEQVKTKDGKDKVAKWTKIYLKKVVELQAEIKEGLLNDVSIMTEDDIDEEYFVGDASRSKQTF